MVAWVTARVFDTELYPARMTRDILREGGIAHFQMFRCRQRPKPPRRPSIDATRTHHSRPRHVIVNLFPVCARRARPPELISRFRDAAMTGFGGWNRTPFIYSSAPITSKSHHTTLINSQSITVLRPQRNYFVIWRAADRMCGAVRSSAAVVIYHDC